MHKQVQRKNQTFSSELAVFSDSRLETSVSLGTQGSMCDMNYF